MGIQRTMTPAEREDLFHLGMREFCDKYHVHWTVRSRWIRDSQHQAAEVPLLNKVGKPDRPGVTQTPGSVTVTGEPGRPFSLGDIQRILGDRGLNPAEWMIERTVVNEWEAHAVISSQWVKATNHQLKVTLIPRPEVNFLIPARLDGPRFTNAAPPAADEPQLVVVLPDQQAPYQDPRLHDLALAWLAENQPHQMVISGDGTDFPTISRHPRKAHELHARAQDCIDSMYGLLRDYTEAAGSRLHTKQYVKGNHEIRLERHILGQAPELYGLRRAGVDGPGVLDLGHLLRLDELGFDMARDPVYQEDYPAGHVLLSDKLAVYHGWIARPKAGASGLTTLEHLGHSVMVGHTHRQAITPHTYHEIGGKLRTLVAVECGTMATVRGGLGYSVNPDWQPGFATVWLYPDGFFHAQLAQYVNGVLLWENQRYGNPL